MSYHLMALGEIGMTVASLHDGCSLMSNLNCISHCNFPVQQSTLPTCFITPVRRVHLVRACDRARHMQSRQQKGGKVNPQRLIRKASAMLHNCFKCNHYSVRGGAERHSAGLNRKFANLPTTLAKLPMKWDRPNLGIKEAAWCWVVSALATPPAYLA